MALQFLACGEEPDGAGVYDVWKVDTIHLPGELLTDRVLEDVGFTITRLPNGDLRFACPKASDRAYLQQSCISMEALWQKAQTYLAPGEEAFRWKGRNASGATVVRDVEIWDDAGPLPEGLRLREGAPI